MLVSYPVFKNWFSNSSSMISCLLEFVRIPWAGVLLGFYILY